MSHLLKYLGNFFLLARYMCIAYLDGRFVEAN